MIFDHGGSVVGIDQKEHEQIFPKPGWVEHDPKRSGPARTEVVDGALKKANSPRATSPPSASRTSARPPSCGTGHRRARLQRPRLAGHAHRQDICDALAADGGQDRFRAKTGLPLATYFSGTKVRWILDNVEGARARAEAGDLHVRQHRHVGASGTSPVASTAARHVTDVTNASRTMLMDLATLDWDDDLLSAIGVPRSMLPSIEPSSAVYGEAQGHARRHPGRRHPR